MGEEPRTTQAAGDDHPSAALCCQVWGVLNVTPDSFSDGGRYLDPDAACEQARRMLEEGADVVDVGGESSRPPGKTYGAGAERVPAYEELKRVLPVVERLSAMGARISVDTVKWEVAEQVVQAGAHIINDISGGRDVRLLEVVAKARVELVLMHNRGRGERSGDNVRYGDVVSDVRAELLGAVERACEAGVARERVWIDPGLGFAKTAAQSTALLAHTDTFVQTGLKVLVGASRKSFLGEAAPLPDGTPPAPDERLSASTAAVAHAAGAGCHAVRVHDVKESHQALGLARALAAAKGAR